MTTKQFLLLLKVNLKKKKKLNLTFKIKIFKDWCYEEPGVRGLKRCFETLLRKYAVELLQKNPELVEIQQTH